MTRGFATNTTFAERARRKMVLAISGLAVIVLSLFSIVTYMVLGGGQTTQAAVTAASDAPAAKLEMVDVLIAATRIESGTRLDANMFSLQSYEKDRIPFSVIPAAHEDMALGKFAKRMIRAGFPISQDDISEKVPLGDLPIPPGYRAVSIYGTQTELVNGYVVPNSRVDILFHYTDQRGRKAVKTLIEFVKVLSVDGTDQDNKRRNIGAGATATLLVTIRDAQRIELARGMGKITLALRGTKSNGSETPPASPVTHCDVVGDCGQGEPELPDGTMVLPDRNGRLIKYVLHGNRWVRTALDESEM